MLLDKKLISANLLFHLALMCLLMLLARCVGCWMLMLPLIIVLIWVFPLVLEKRKKLCFKASMTKFGRGFKDGI